MTAVLFITCSTWDEVEQSAKKVVESKRYAIASAAGLLVLGDKAAVIGAFTNMIKLYCFNSGEPYNIVTQVKDALGTDAVAIGANTPQGAYLYGVDPQEFLQSYTLLTAEPTGSANN